MKAIYVILLSQILSFSFGYGQLLNKQTTSFNTKSAAPSNGYAVNWRVNPYDKKIFIENRGQFDKVLKSNTKVRYGANLGEMTAYFTSNGMTYRYDEYTAHKTIEENENEETEREALRNYKTHYLEIVWEGANPDVSIVASEKRPDYYIYPTGPATSLQTSLYKKITYKDLYPGIDVEYIFPDDKEGLKYTIIVHPGGDLRKVKLKYIGANKIKKNKDGDVVISSNIGDFIDHSPISYYEEENTGQIHSANSIDDNIESFGILDSLNSGKTLVIDPWITNPFGYGGRPGPWDIDYDYNGNVYAGCWYGLVKLNNTGIVQWTYVLAGGIYNGTYEDFTVDRVSGNSFIVGLNGYSGGLIQKISTTGGLIATAKGPVNLAWEFWRAAWNPCTDQIIIGAGGTNGDGTSGTNRYQAAITNLNLAPITIMNVMGVNVSNCDMVGVTIDPDGSTCYMANVCGNKIVKLPLPALTPTLFNQPEGYAFKELGHNRYTDWPYATAHNGMNVMAAGRNWLYMWDGYTIKQFNKATGALNASSAILPPVIGTAGNSNGAVQTFWSGIDVDACEKIYAGYQTTIKVFNSSLTQTNVINLPSNLDTVTDVAVGVKGKTIYACGSIGFITSIEVLGAATDTITKVTTSATCACNGTATATLALCGGPVTTGVTYLWSNGQTTQTATGLCAGTHNVTLFYNCKPYPDTVKILSQSGLTISQAQNNVQCYGGNTGSSTVSVNGGTSPYTYIWTPSGSNNSSATNLSAGTYTCSVTDASGCKITSIIKITEPNPSITSGSSTNNSCTTTGSASVTVAANGPYSYTWTPSGGSGPTAYGLAAGNYTVTVTAGNGCIQTKTFNITGTNPVSAAFTQSQINACTNTAVNFINTGSTGTYVWTNSSQPYVSGTTVNYSVTFLSAGTYSVTHTVSSGGCTANVTSNVYVTNCNAPTVTATGSSVCQGSCATVSSNGTGGTSPYSYTWSNGGTTQNISPCPASTTTYTITIKDAGGNTSTTTATVVINPSVLITASPTNITCYGGTNGSIQANPGNGTTPYTYNWSTGVSGSGFQVSGLSAGNYTVTLTDSKGCMATSTAVIISPTPLVGQFTKGTANCATCGCKEWIMITAAGGTIPYSYSWPDGYVNRYRNQLCTGAYTVNVKDKNGCSVNLNLTAP